MRQYAGERDAKRQILCRLNSGTRKIVLTERLVLRFVLNAIYAARVVAEAEIELMIGRDNMIDPDRIVCSRLGDRKYLTQLGKRTKRNQLAGCISR